MKNNIFLQTYTKPENYLKSHIVTLPLESFITYCIYKYCAPEKVKLHFVSTSSEVKEQYISVADKTISITEVHHVPWQVTSCIYPVVMWDDTIVTGLCAVVRHISQYRSQKPSSEEHEEGLLGFRKSCLQAPNEVSIWTKFCEVDILKSVKEVLNAENINAIPKNLVRFENHLGKPVRVHNVFKIAREKDQGVKKNANVSTAKETTITKTENVRTAKNRKWKSNTKNAVQDVCCKIEDLNLSHQFAEGPFLTIADLVLLPSYSLMIQIIGPNIIESLLPLTMKWYTNLCEISELKIFQEIIQELELKSIFSENITLPVTDGASLYKCDPSRHNPKKRLFTKEIDIENALNALEDNMKLDVSSNDFNSTINWSSIPDGANPTAGHLPDTRMTRKSQQLENLTLAVLSIAKEGDKIVDFCSGSGHLGILIAYLLPKCTILLLENKEQSLLRARKRVHDMNLKNVFFFQCNLDFFVGNFDIGIALHACGIASDLVLDKCLQSNAKFVLCPCCYGSLHSTDRLAYPRSVKFNGITIDQYLCIGHTADQTHEEHPLTVRGDLCMAVIDSDRARLAEECGYKVTLSRLKPLSCTPKNNLLIGVPS